MSPRFYPVYRREIKAYFQSPAIYVVAGLYFAMAGLFFHDILIYFAQMCMNPNLRSMTGVYELNLTQFVVRNTFGLLSFLMLFVAPILTMRLIAEEKKSGTFELLVTCPLRDWDLLLGKFLACLSIIGTFIIVCLTYPVVLEILGKPETPVIASCYLGLFLISASYVSFGLFASSVTENQIVSAIICFAGLLVFYLVGDLASAESGLIGSVLDGLSVRLHSMNFTKGVIELRDIAYFVLFTVFFLFLSAKVLQSRHWRV
jgi:ABC-2 type transport system permease protein